MELLKRMTMAVAATGIATLPIAAYAVERDAAPVTEGNEIGGGASPAFVIIALAGAGMAVLLLTEDDNEPVSG
ncbi:hypothetical protein LY632_06490 [Erythrobacter sp. SDW2]|uniref:hypothetical protein n=1 Tax=Erythrobacter sp. SDW2 TaxID=2907154 RepID=UPI001F30AD8D|nr:hypothetical protein [Erythrobacter sp. SDW2]UIP08036.1 hypothetical protein LY632_06490 [Erythrobacter sp. SDW2]